MESYKTHRHERNSKEKELHNRFIEENGVHNEDMDLIVFGHSGQSTMPNDCLTEREKRIVISTIQWLGSPVGQSFLGRCGFEQI